MRYTSFRSTRSDDPNYQFNPPHRQFEPVENSSDMSGSECNRSSFHFVYKK
jgi:hypothetical protein